MSDVPVRIGAGCEGDYEQNMQYVRPSCKFTQDIDSCIPDLRNGRESGIHIAADLPTCSTWTPRFLTARIQGSVGGHEVPYHRFQTTSLFMGFLCLLTKQRGGV